MGKSAGSGGGGGDQRNKDIENRNTRPASRGNVFGVDGVSKTGSTARDAAIGFTSGEGSGRAGANFGALQGATRETRDRAVAAAQQAQRQGASLAAQQRAAGSTLGVPTPGSRISQAVDAMRAQQVARPSRADEVAGIGRQPSIGQGIAGITGTGSFMSGATTRPETSPSPLASLLNQAMQTPAMDMSNMTNMALSRGIRNPVNEAELNRRALAGDQDAMSLFDNALVKGYIQPFNQGVTDQFAPDTLGSSTFAADDLAGDLALNPDLFAGAPVTMEDAQNAIFADSLAPPQVGPPAAQMLSIGPAPDFIPGTGTSSFYSNLTDLGVVPVESISDSGRPTATSATPQGGFYGEDTLQADVFGVPGGVQGELYGFPDAAALGEFQSNAMRGPNAISQLMNFSLLNRGVEALTGTSPSESNMEAGRQNMRNLFDLGGAFNPETGRVEAALPSGQLQMNQFGNVTYSGMPDPNYTGAFSNLVNPPEREGGQQIPQVMDMVEEAPADPCPAGYAMVNGSCQPTDQMTGAVQPAQPVAPPVFQPAYQPFQPQPLNPFVLSPQSGISGISPTGAALGRSV
jgi:hypothetical protein